MFILLVPYYYVNNGTSLIMLGLILPIKFPIKNHCDWDSGMKTIMENTYFKLKIKLNINVEWVKCYIMYKWWPRYEKTI